MNTLVKINVSEKFPNFFASNPKFPKEALVIFGDDEPIIRLLSLNHLHQKLKIFSRLDFL